ncbi:MAG: cadherin domain-containing protein [Chloroflexi bacterium]|nr:cadherin domain-containing protein [Chloroflexota bacterium]
MKEIVNEPNRFRRYAAGLVLSAVALTLLAVAFANEPAQAQNPADDNAGLGAPLPCGPGAETAFQPEPHEIIAGHYALFDAYWQWREVATPGVENSVNEGVLHTNLCPPAVTETTEPGPRGPRTVISLTPSGLDVGEAIFHILDGDKATVVSGDVDNSDGTQISTQQFVELAEYAEAGASVWWLQLDDPDTSEDEGSALTIGFSTMRFDDRYWGDAPDDQPPLRYKFELERNPGISPADHPHFLAYRAAPADGPSELVWDSAAPDVDDMIMEPGQLEDLQWIFTKPGTYAISVHLLGWVRQAAPADAGENWLPIDGKLGETETETSEVKRYVFQVGTEFTEVEPARFGFSFTVDENAAAGTPVGQPIQAFAEDLSILSYSLSGHEAQHFTLDTTNPGHVQIEVADGADLDYEVQSRYDLMLEVTDNVDHENNPDSSIDHFVVVQIHLRDIVPTVTLVPSNRRPALGETVTFTVVFQHPEEVVGSWEWDINDNDSWNSGDSTGNNVVIRSDVHNQYRQATYDLTVGYRSNPNHPTLRDLDAAPVTVTWGSQ